MMARLSRERDRASRERGSVSVWVVIFGAISVLLMVLIVDGGQAMLAKVHLADIAEQAARAAADDVDTTSLRDTGAVSLAGDACATSPPGPADLIVSSYGSSSGLNATMTSCGPQANPPAGLPEQVDVTVSATITPILSLIFKSYTVTSTESATVFCGTFDAQGTC
jgi:Flp pilus assembly protein TadG